jgi:hypothetical protein
LQRHRLDCRRARTGSDDSCAKDKRARLQKSPAIEHEQASLKNEKAALMKGRGQCK